jgi:AcrR family transcriptional regulator
MSQVMMSKSRSIRPADRTGLRARKKLRTQQLIADTALRLFLAHGFDAVTVVDIARAAEVDAKTIYNYFQSKEDLVYSRFESFESRLLDAIRDRRPGESILAAFGRFVLEPGGLLAEQEASGKLKAISEMIAGSPKLLAHEQLHGVLWLPDRGGDWSTPGRSAAVGRRERDDGRASGAHRVRAEADAGRRSQRRVGAPRACQGEESARRPRGRARSLRSEGALSPLGGGG